MNYDMHRVYLHHGPPGCQWEEDELVTTERKVSTRPITFHRTLAEMGIAEWADIYVSTTKENIATSKGYTVGNYGKQSRGHGGSYGGDIRRNCWARKGEKEHRSKVSGVREKRKTAECWEGGRILDSMG
eukprot:6181982-Pleurochrysis_carterae.AAC.3